MTDVPSTRIVSGTAPSGPLWLMVLGAEQLATHPLPPRGELTIGRSPSCDITIQDKSISRQHAVLRIGDTITIEDLASANGTRVGGNVVAPHRPTVIKQSEIVELGEVSMLIQRRAPTMTLRRLWSHGYFEGRLEDECARAGDGGTFAVVFLHCGPDIPVDHVQRTLADVLQPIDVAGEYGAGEYEVLLVDTTPELAEARAARLLDGLATEAARDFEDGGGDTVVNPSARKPRIEARTGIACFPRDGRTPDTLLAHAASKARPTPVVTPGGFVVEDPAMIQLRKVVDRVATGTLSVLLLGETGVGKEVLAELVHRRSPRATKPFLRLNCAAVTESLLESELFGHEKGAFTGAAATKPGLLETAQGGTVFLDEVGEISPSIQVKLLRVLEERKVMRVGGLKASPIDVRFVAATNRDLEAEIERGRFRQDLYYRLAGITLVIPPLRERVSEIPALAQAFITGATQGAQKSQLSREALELLERYSWPGNIRELRNVIERAVLLSNNGVIRPEHLPVEKMRTTYQPRPRPRTPTPEPIEPDRDDDGTDQTPALDALYPGDAERDRIVATLELCRGNQTKAARILGMSRRTLIYRLERYGITRPRKGRE